MPAAASGAGFGGAQPPSNWFAPVRRVNRAAGTFSAKNAQQLLRSNLLSKRPVAGLR